jgi:hypothetical protein
LDPQASTPSGVVSDRLQVPEPSGSRQEISFTGRSLACEDAVMLRAGGSRVRPAIFGLLAGLLLASPPDPATAQSIVIDTPVRAGKLILFPKIRDEKVYYYAPIQPHLATDENGGPQFSFLRYVSVAEARATRTRPRRARAAGSCTRSSRSR